MYIGVTLDSLDHVLLLKIIHELEDKNRLLDENSQLLKYKITKLKNEYQVCSRCDKNTSLTQKEKIIKPDKLKINTDGIEKVVSKANVARTATGYPVPVTKVVDVQFDSAT